MLPQTSPKQNYTTINTSVKIRGKITLGAHANLPNATPTTASPQDASLGADANLPNATPPNATEVATAGEVAVDMVVEVMVEIEVAAVMGEGMV